MTFIAGKVSLFLFMLFAMATILYAINKSKNGEAPKIRRIAGLDSIEEGLGRATEMGRPVHYTPGLSDITADTAPQTFAGLEILAHVTQLAAKYDTSLIVTIRQPNVYPMAEETVKQGYLSAGKPQSFTPDTVRFLSSEQFAYAAGVVGIFMREHVAANLMMGAFWAESLLFAEAGSQAGAIQIAGTAAMAQIPFFVAACDYTLIGEELYAGGAYLSQDRVKLGSIYGQDLIKAVVMGAIILGVALETFQVHTFTQLLKK